MAKASYGKLRQSHRNLLKTVVDGHKQQLDMEAEAQKQRLEHAALLHSLMLQHAQFCGEAGLDGYLHGMAHVASAPGYDPAFYEQLGRHLRANGFDDAGKVNLALALAQRQHQQWHQRHQQAPSRPLPPPWLMQI